MSKKIKIVISIIVVLLIIAAASVVYYAKFYKEDINQHLPITETMTTRNPENIAYSLWHAYLKPYEETVNPFKKLDARYIKFQGLTLGKDRFTIDIVFTAQLKSKKWSTHRDWGHVQKDGTIKNLKWTLNIKKTGKDTYTLEHIGKMKMPFVESTVPEAKSDFSLVDKVVNEQCAYDIKNGRLLVTYDYGKHWGSVPVSVKELFEGDYSGPKDTLIDGSYLITPERTAFVIGSGMYLRILQSTDEGETWNEYNVQSPFDGVRLRKLGFTSKENGYLILTGDRTMSFEGNAVLKTHDGGKTWDKVGGVKTDRLATDGGFINDSLGFMSFGSRGTPAHPVFYRTTDGGKTWSEIEIPIPAEYRGIFTEAEMPTFDGSDGTLLVNQGPNGDYQGGKVLAKFTSKDKGKTWVYDDIVNPK